jgi:5-carboxymethyl-2-hydroxymuconate isomerase
MHKKSANYNKYKYKKRKSKKILFIIFLFVLLGIVYLLLFSPVFEVKEISIFGNQKISSDEIKNNLICKNIILVTSKNIKNQLSEKFPEILESKISKNFLKRKLTINITEREEIGIICSGDPAFAKASVGTCFYFDNDGIVFKNAPTTSGSLITIIQDYSNRKYAIGDKISEKSFIDIILEISENLFAEIGLKVSNFNIDSYPIEELKATTNEGWYVLFSLKRDIKSQLLALKVALNEKIQSRTSLQYIDLRIENRIYYK